MPFTAPNVDSATKTGIHQATGPNNLSAKETATASELSISKDVRVVKNATFVKTYTTVTKLHDIAIANGRFLKDLNK